jgi:hypothetical protein
MNQRSNQTDRDKLTRRVTAFPDWQALEAAMHQTGYVPTLRRDQKQPAALGAIIEGLGRRVFWIGRGASHAA